MKERLTSGNRTSLAATVAPEDLRCGDYVALLNEIFEFPAFLCSDSAFAEHGETIRIQLQASDAGKPLKVKAICLPFVFVKTASRKRQTIDVRQAQLVRLDRQYGRKVWKKMRRKSK